MYLSKKLSILLLTIFFVFDNVVSYFAITRMGGKELNSVIAPYVTANPSLYFLCIPAEVAGMLLIMWMLRQVIVTAIRPARKEIIEAMILTAIVIYWPIANSSLNFMFLMGVRGLGYLWGPLTALGFVTALVYGITAVAKVSRKK